MGADGRVAKALKYFGKKEGQTLSDFANEWRELSEPSKDQLVNGIADGTLNY